MTTPEGPYFHTYCQYADRPDLKRFAVCGEGLDAVLVYRQDAASITARLNQQHAEIKRLREALTNICSAYDIYSADPDSGDVEGEYAAAALIAWSALKPEPPQEAAQ